MPWNLMSNKWFIFVECLKAVVSSMPMHSTFLSKYNTQFSPDYNTQIVVSEAKSFPVSQWHSQITYYEQGKYRKVTRNDKRHHVQAMSNLIKDKPWKDKKKSPEHSPGSNSDVPSTSNKDQILTMEQFGHTQKKQKYILLKSTFKNIDGEIIWKSFSSERRKKIMRFFSIYIFLKIYIYIYN